MSDFNNTDNGSVPGTGIDSISTPTNDWKSSLSDELKSSPSIGKFNDVDSLAKSYVSLEQRLGNSIRIPGQDAGQEDLDKFYSQLSSVKGVVRIPGEGDVEGMNNLYNSLGRPSAPEFYKIDLGGAEVNQATVDHFKQTAHSLGLNNNQAEALVKYQLAMEQAQLDDFNNLAAATERTLKAKWGDDFNNRLHGAKAALEMYRDEYPEAVAALTNGKEGVNPVILNMLSDLYAGMKEKGSIKGASSIQYGKTPEAAREEIAEIRRNPQMMEALNNQWHPNHKEVYGKMEGLYKIATTKKV